MIEKIKNHINDSAEDKVLSIDKKDIEQYLSAYILFQIIRKQIGGDHYGRERKKRFLHRV